MFALVLALSGLAFEDYAKLAPYTDVRWVDDAPEVEVGGEWVTLLEIDGTPVADIVDFAKQTWPDRWRMRFAEDLVEVLSRMGKPPGPAVALRIRDARGERTLDAVAMTQANRNRVRDAGRPQPVRAVPRDRAADDLDVLKRLIDERYSYAQLRGVKYGEALDAIKARLPEEVAVRALELEIERVLVLFKDGHTGVAGQPLPPGYLPFLLAEAEGGVVAFRAQGGWVEPGHPFVRSIDGVDIGQWLEAASRITPIETRRARTLRYVRFFRSEMGLPLDAPLRVVLASAAGAASTIELPLAATRPLYGERRGRGSGMLEGNIGYLRLAEMDDHAVQEIRTRMEEFRGSAGLVIDVRGNGGGSRAALRALFPYFMRPSDAPRVANVAAPRKPVEGSLEDRWLFPAGSASWTAAEGDAIRKLAFVPEWTPPADQFGEWHYFVLSHGAAPFTYDNQVVILMDGDCFSATDILLGAFKGWRHVTLAGTRSGGGSGRALGYQLPASGILVRLSSMASFQPNGRLYDGRGVEPDVEIRPTASDIIGATDTVLDTAVQRLVASRGTR